jgi:hypothetical protein
MYGRLVEIAGLDVVGVSCVRIRLAPASPKPPTSSGTRGAFARDPRVDGPVLP